MRHKKPKNLKDIERRKEQQKKSKEENRSYYQNGAEWHFPRRKG